MSPQSEISNKLNLKEKPKLNLLSKSNIKNKEHSNNRYIESKASSRMNRYIAKSFMENSNVHNKIANELMKSKPIWDLRKI